MSKINFFKKNEQITDYNYSFCDESQVISTKENYCPNTGQSLHARLDGLQKLIRRQFNLQAKDDKIIKEQAVKLNRMSKCIEQINRTLYREQKGSHQSHHLISSISEQQNDNKSSIFTYSNHNSHNRESIKKSSQNSKNLQSYERSFLRHSSNRIKSQASKSKRDKENMGLSKNVRHELLSKIVQRKHVIEKQLKERLNNHLKKENAKSIKSYVNYMSYATQR